MPFLSVIIPVYNVEKYLGQCVDSVIRQEIGDFELILVDDGSPDGTGDMVAAEVEKNPRIHLIRRKGKMGLGSAYVTGFKWALERDFERVFEMDADFSHSPTDLNRFLETAEDADLVLGSRYKDRRISVVNWDLHRLILSYGANIYTRIVTRLPVSDATGGFKCFRREALQALNLDKMKSDGYCFQIETTFKIWKKGLRVKEIPIVFTDRTRGTSKMSGGIISEAFFLVLKLRLGLA